MTDTHNAPAIHDLPLRFTGSGSEYFRIWIVNLLLTLVTLSLYWPFARARRMAYFHRNTWVGGDALGFHGDPWKMFYGHVMMVMLGIVYFWVSQLTPEYTALPVLVLMVLWPALWRSSLIFRLRNTSWRGVRFDFAGSLGGAYAVMLPLAGFLALFLLVGVLSKVPGLMQQNGVQMAIIVAGLLLLGLGLLFPWLVARLHAYRHSGFVFAGERTTLAAGPLSRAFYGFGFKVMASVVLMFLGITAFMAVTGMMWSGWALVSVFGLYFLALFYLVFPLVLGPYFKVRLQNLTWGRTRSENVVLQSQLRFGDFFKTHLVNWLLIIVTCGLYWPFATVRLARVRLEAISVQVRGDIETWIAQEAQHQGGVLGDAAGDFFGVDIGL